MRILEYQTFVKTISVLLWVTSTSLAGIIFEDDFSRDPQNNGWDLLVTSTGTAVGEIALSPSGGQVLFDKTAGTGTLRFSIFRTVSTSGFRDITLNLTAFQANTGFESSDFLEIEYNPGTGFVSLLKDVEVWNGENDLTGDGSSGTDGQTLAVSTGELLLPAATFNNPLLAIRINGSANANSEDYFLDHISVSGTATAIPETSPLLCFGLLASLALGKQVMRRSMG